MPIMNTVMGGVGTGVQPKDAQGPMNGPSAAVQTFDNSLPPPGMPRPQPQAPGQGQTMGPPTPPIQGPPSPLQPQSQGNSFAQPPQTDQEDKDVDSLINQLASKEQPKGVKEQLQQHNEDVDNLINTIAGAKSESQNAEPGEGAAQNLPDKFKFAAAQMRAHLGRDPLEQRSAFESMYGQDNVKSMGGKLMFRPDADSKFRGVDEKLLGPGIDWALFNLANVPGLAAQVIAGAAVTPVAGPIAGGAAAGAAGATVNQGMIDTGNAMSSVPQDDVSFGSDLTKQTEYGALGGAVAGGLVGGAARVPGALAYVGQKVPVLQAAADKIQGALSPIGDAALAAGGNAMEKMSQIRTAIGEFKDIVFPASARLSTENPGEIGTAVGNAVDKTHEILSNQLDLMKDHAIALAEQKDKAVDTTSTMQAIKSQVQQYGYSLDKNGDLIPIPGAASGLSQGPVSSAVKDLTAMHNNLQDQQVSQGGRKLEYFLNDLEQLRNKADYDVVNNSNQNVLNMYRNVREAAAGDRNDFLKGLYEQTNMPEEQSVVGAISKYEGNIGAIKQFSKTFSTPEQRSFLIDSLSKAPSAETATTLNNIKQIVGEDSPEWNSLKSGVFDNILSKNTKADGTLNTGAISKSLTSTANAPSEFASKLFSLDQAGTLKRMMAETKNINDEVGIPGSTQSAIQKGMSLLVKLAAKPVDFAAQCFGLLENNVKSVNYMVDDGFLKMARDAEGPDMKRRIMDAMRVTDAVRQKMQIVNVPTVTQRGIKEVVQKYAPVAGPMLDQAIQGAMGSNKFQPGNTMNPPPQAPQAPIAAPQGQ